MSAVLAASALVTGVDAVAGAEFLGAFRAAGGDQEVGGGPAGSDHAAEQGLADLAGAEDCDFLGHGAVPSGGASSGVILAPVGGGAVSGGGCRSLVRCPSGGVRRPDVRPRGRQAVRRRRVAAPRARTRRAQPATITASRTKSAVMSVWLEDLVHAVDGVGHGQDVGDGLQDGVHGVARGEEAAEEELGEDHRRHELDRLELGGREGRDEEAEGRAEQGVEEGDEQQQPGGAGDVEAQDPEGEAGGEGGLDDGERRRRRGRSRRSGRPCPGAWRGGVPGCPRCVRAGWRWRSPGTS